MCGAPPDVAEALSTSLTLLAQGSAKAEATPAEVSARLEATRTLATSVRSLFSRSQGAQFLRDGLFSLCQGYLNGAIKDPEYADLYKELLKKSHALILEELPAIKDKRADDAAINADTAAKEAQKAASEAAASAKQAKQAADRADTGAKKSEPKP